VTALNFFDSALLSRWTFASAAATKDKTELCMLGLWGVIKKNSQFGIP